MIGAPLWYCAAAVLRRSSRVRDPAA